MNTNDLRFLAERADTLGAQPDRLQQVHQRIRTARRRRATVAVGSTVGAVGAIAMVAVILTGPSDRAEGPIDAPAPSKSLPTLLTPPAVELGPGQVLVEADVRPEDMQRWDDGVTVIADPGATSIDSAAVAARTQYVAPAGFCRGDLDVWWVVTSGEGGYGQCAPDARLAGTPPAELTAADPFSPKKWDRGDWAAWNSSRDQDTLGTEQYWEPETSMFLTSQIPAGVRECVDQSIAEHSLIGGEECLARLEPLENADARFGFTLFQEIGPHVATVLDQGFEALAVVDGTDYQFSFAVEQHDTDSFTLQLPESGQARIVGLRVGRDRELAVLVDGEAPAEQPFLARFDAIHQTALIPPGAHTITVEVTSGGPVDLAAVVYQASS